MASADAIDGDWCAPNQPRRVSIEGSKITISSGTVVLEALTRLEFLYVVPNAERDSD
ncbi:MAG: hypothetical protein AAGG56_01065 [Pseudomonadota bacterium]